MTSRRAPLSRRCVQLAGALLALGLLYLVAYGAGRLALAVLGAASRAIGGGR